MLQMEKHDPSAVLSSGEHKGFRWVILHNGIGFRCGYVAVPEDHPWHGKQYNDVDADVHWGLTYADYGTDGEWYLGFDCAHAGDGPCASLPVGSPIVRQLGGRDGVVRDDGYVEQECRNLCEAASQAACSASEPRVICDFFIDYGGVEYVCEVYRAYDERIEDIGLYPLQEDGSKGESVDPHKIPIWEQAQQKYESWLFQRFDDDVI